MKSAKIINSSDTQVDRPGLWFYSWSTKTYSENIPPNYGYTIWYNGCQVAYFNENMDLAVFPESFSMIRFTRQFKSTVRRCWGKDMEMVEIGRPLKLDDFEVIV
jgi:hypothetical protein